MQAIRARGFKMSFFGNSRMKSPATSNETNGDGNKMTRLNDLGRRSFLKIAAVLGGASTVGALPNLADAQDSPQQTDNPAITLQDVPFSCGAKLTIERRGQIVLFGINRPYIKNRIDPETFEQLAEAYKQYHHDPSLRAAILFGHGENFSRGIDVWNQHSQKEEEKCQLFGSTHRRKIRGISRSSRENRLPNPCGCS